MAGDIVNAICSIFNWLVELLMGCLLKYLLCLIRGYSYNKYFNVYHLVCVFIIVIERFHVE